MPTTPRGQLPTNARRWERIKNVGSNTIPAFGLFIVTGATSRGGEVILEADRPTAATEGLIKSFGVNGPNRILTSKYGWGTFHFPAVVSYDDSDTPEFGHLWGLQEDEFTAKKGNNGLLVVGDPQSKPNRVVMDHRGHYHKPLFIRFTLTDTLATTDASTTDFTVSNRYSGISSGVTDPTTLYNLPISSDYAHEGENGDTGWAFYDWNDDRYYIFRMEC